MKFKLAKNTQNTVKILFYRHILHNNNGFYNKPIIYSFFDCGYDPGITVKD